jgi:class 3 adenylate cyclase
MRWRSTRVPEPPGGTVTFLFIDVERSTRLWEPHPAEMRLGAARRDALVEVIVGDHGGILVRPRGEGDSRFAVFAQASDTVAAALQRALHADAWITLQPLRVRIAVQTGEAKLREGEYYAAAVNRCAHLRSLATGVRSSSPRRPTISRARRCPPGRACATWARIAWPI